VQGRIPRFRLSSSRLPRLGRPYGPSHAIGYADPRPSTHSQGFCACEEDGEKKADASPVAVRRA
jgi:hypothetical protein